MTQIIKTVSATEIAGMYATPVEILPAPGPNQTYVLNSVFAHCRFNTTAYTIGSAGQLILCYGSLMNLFKLVAPLPNFMDQTADQFNQSDLLDDGPVAASAAINQAMLLTNDTNALTAGDGTLTLTIDYSVINVTTQ